MKISLNWLKKYVNIPDGVSDDDLIRLIGARLVEVESVIDETHKYDNIFVVSVVTCEKIPDTHLSLCQIDAGGDELTQVVCGAPNVHEGMLAVWIAPGAVVPASVHEDAPFVIGKRKMRGYESAGMLAGADELDFGDDHSGIVEIDPEVARPGDLLKDVLGLNDKVLEIENKSLTHRPDCFGVIGFAREVAGILGIKFVTPTFVLQESESLDLSHVEGAEKCKLKILIEDLGVCQRYSAMVLEKHGEMKKHYLSWQDTMLSKAGMKPIGPIVDATNYLMLLTGQPLHAFDYDKFIAVGGTESPEIKVRLAKHGEKMMLLDDKEVELCKNDIVICSGDTPVALAGAMGGKSTEIDENTKNIIIESATFSLYNLRKTQMEHGIFTEAITRFTKGQPPFQTLAVASECANMLTDGFKVTFMADEYPKPVSQTVVKITTERINELLGTHYDCRLMVDILQNVGFCVTNSGEQLTIEVPVWRTDIKIMEDIVEEIGRLLGYDSIEPVLPPHKTAERNRLFELKGRIREILCKYGANEILTYSFVNKNLLEKAGQDIAKSYRIVNSISPDLQYIRQSIVPSLLDKAYINQKMPVERFALFELNEVYSKSWGLNDEKVPNGKAALGLVIAERKNTETAFYKAKKYAKQLFDELNIEVSFVPHKCEMEAAAPFESVRTADIMLNGQCVGVVGEFKNSVRNGFKLGPYLAGFEIVDLGGLLGYLGGVKTIDLKAYKTEDLTLTTDKTYAEVLNELTTRYPKSIIAPLSIYRAPGQRTRNVSVRIKTPQ